MVGACRACDAPLRWAVTINGNPVALDALPSERGTLRLEPTAPGSEIELAVYVREVDRPKHAGALYRVHRVGCPAAVEQRRAWSPSRIRTGLRYEGD